MPSFWQCERPENNVARVKPRILTSFDGMFNVKAREISTERSVLVTLVPGFYGLFVSEETPRGPKKRFQGQTGGRL
jgi:hypothetical protein